MVHAKLRPAQHQQPSKNTDKIGVFCFPKVGFERESDGNLRGIEPLDALIHLNF
jgi:hypothetical protein